jgi:hypothetical protein
MSAVNNSTRAQVRRALEAGNENARDALVAIALDVGISWCSPAERVTAAETLASAGHTRLAAQLREGASVEAVKATAEQHRNADALRVIRGLFGDEPARYDDTSVLMLRLLGPEEQILTEIGPFSGGITYWAGGEDEGPSIRTDGDEVVAHNDNVNPGLWVGDVLFESSGFSLELRKPQRDDKSDQRSE